MGCGTLRGRSKVSLLPGQASSEGASCFQWGQFGYCMKMWTKIRYLGGAGEQDVGGSVPIFSTASIM